MNKKILTISIVVVFMLLAISFASTVSSNTSKPIRKESPLFGIRIRKAVNEKISEVVENIKTKYIGERVFFLPFQFLSLKWQKLTDDSPPKLWSKDAESCETYKCSEGIISCSICD